MSSITFSENHESSFIAYDDGQPLACLRDPRAEGLKWAYSLGPMPANHVVIVGLGSGFHVAALADIDAEVQITVVESRESLITVFRSQFPDLKDRVNIVVAQNTEDIFKTDFYQEVVDHRAYVLSFRECWGPRTEFFSQMFAHLTGRTLEAVKYHFQEFGINMKALYLQPDHLLSIKDVLPVVESSNMDDNKKKIFRVLGELVK
ncbi:hypothetical protein [Bdellovibrio reynosensis]|uniref:SAM-dependent methyltransferase n=1 Tax=Bdellovibrio reynosensis TaxID=2835041 RepID=A0ABY4C8Q3_9BACT|nr:hypothetical protein [Bdellovibrio reynosensis]UOE99862.1 hypothetical protein MNR06_09150 [Bdellovibrio reynosensis]